MWHEFNLQIAPLSRIDTADAMGRRTFSLSVTSSIRLFFSSLAASSFFFFFEVSICRRNGVREGGAVIARFCGCERQNKNCWFRLFNNEQLCFTRFKHTSS